MMQGVVNIKHVHIATTCTPQRKQGFQAEERNESFTRDQRPFSNCIYLTDFITKLIMCFTYLFGLINKDSF